MSPRNAEAACYLYGVAQGLAADDVGAVGLRGAPVRTIEHRGLTAIVSDVDLDEFGEDGLRRHLEDLSWLEDVARSHDAVVRAAAFAAPTAPVRLATIYLDDDAVRARLEESHDALRLTLQRVHGRMEWSVKAFLADTSDGDDSPLAPGGDASSGSGVGAAYLRRRKAETSRREHATAAASALADDLHAALSGYSAASRRLAPQDRRLTGDDATMTLNGAYLVDTASAKRFVAAAERLSAEHPESRMRVDGPWPPYSFSALDES